MFRTVFQTNDDLGRELYPHVFNASAKAVPFRILLRPAMGLEKLEQKSLTIISIRLDTIPALDRQTEGRNCSNNIALCMRRILTRDTSCLK